MADKIEKEIHEISLYMKMMLQIEKEKKIQFNRIIKLLEEINDDSKRN